MRYAITRRLTVALLLFLSFSASAQGIGETERLRLENIYLRQKNDSLAHELRLLQEETVFVLWDALSGLSPSATPVRLTTNDFSRNIDYLF